MKALYDNLSYEISQSVTEKYSTSFALATKMLAASIRPSIHAIYGFVRLADEIVDSFHDYDKAVLLDEFERDVYLAIERKISLNPVLHSFQEVVHRYDIDHALIEAFLTSMRWDLKRQNYEDHSSYENYIYGSADVVGLMCLKVFVKGDIALYNKLEYSAKKLGSAFQKVNFLRDLKEDTSDLCRSYFPHLTQNGGQLTSVIKAQIITEIEQDFAEAYVGIVQLPNEARFGVYTAFIYYKRLLFKLKGTKAEKIMNRRIRISNPIKFSLLAKSFVTYKLDLL